MNNAVSVFTQGNSMLDFYIYACKSYVQNKLGQLDKTDVGTKFLTALYPRTYFHLLTNVGLFSEAVLSEIASGQERFVQKYIQEFGSPIQAANLCSSHRNITYKNVKLDDHLYQIVMDKLIQNQGSIVNDYLQQQ